MPRSLVPAFLRSPAELRKELAAMEELCRRAQAAALEAQDKAFRYAQALVHTRAELVAAKAMLEARGVVIPPPRRVVRLRNSVARLQ